jgi:phage gpG-like protein
MTAFTITVQDEQVRAARKALASRVQNMQPVLQSIGEDIVERAKHRFETSTGPDSAKWQANSAATLMMLAERLVNRRNAKGARSYTYSKQGGLLNSKGLAVMGNKKPLIGESGDLRRQIVARADAASVTIGATMKYAAIQQFGGKTGAKSWIPGATIPARPFLPVKSDGSLYPQEQALILQEINEYLMDRL